MGKFNLAEHIQKAQPAQVRDIEVITTEILDAKRAGGEAILTIGRGLIEAKALLSHGEWLPWLEERVEFSERSARNFMRLARDWTNRQALADLGATKALQLLALPESEREAFLGETHEVNGEEKTVIDMTSRELEAAIKERDEALKAAAQAQADQKAADEARAKMAEDMRLANERIAELNDQVDWYSADSIKAQDAVTQLEKELAELKSRPVDVAVQTDPATVEAARKETEERMQAQVDAAKKAQAEAEKAKKSAEDARSKAQAEAAALRIEMAQMEKRAALTADEDLALFRMLFDQAQEIKNKMNGVVLKVRPKDPEKAQGLTKALLALADSFREVAAQ